VSDLPTGPIPVVTGRHRRRRPWRVLLVVVVMLALVAVAAGVGVSLLRDSGSATAGGSSSPDPATPIPVLLPGAPVLTPPTRATPAVRVAGVGFDVSYPQCRSVLPAAPAFGIVGVNGGAPLLSNKCLDRQIAWARRTAAHAVYMNTSYSGVGDPVSYGRRLVDDAIAREHAAGAGSTSMWWLDVEVTNTWKGTAVENATVLDSMAVRLQQLGARVGIYTSPAQWFEVAGAWEPGLPIWNATGIGHRAAAEKSCAEQFAGSTTSMVQWVEKTSGGQVLDHDVVCPAWSDRGGDLFDLSGR
jgi:hypothetical protein